MPQKDNPPKKALAQQGSRIQQWILSIAIAVVFTLFINYGISTIWEDPNLAYDKYCPQPKSIPDNETGCTLSGGSWTETGQTYDEYSYKPYLVKAVPLRENATGYCDPHATCRKTFENAAQQHQRNGFVVSVITGLLALLSGLFITLQSVSTGLSLGGLFTLFIGTVSYWVFLSKYAQLGILAITLITLIWAGYKKLGK